jgi:hypothetical protein
VLGENETQTLEVGCSRNLGITDNIISVIGFVVLFGSIILHETITPAAWAILIALWLVRDLWLTKGKSFLYYLTKGSSNYLYIKPLTPNVSL